MWNHLIRRMIISIKVQTSNNPSEVSVIQEPKIVLVIKRKIFDTHFDVNFYSFHSLKLHHIKMCVKCYFKYI